MKDASLNIPFVPFSPAIDAAKVSKNILIGTNTLKQGKFNEAIAAFKEAVTIEENMVYNEPRDWILNPKHYLGDAYIKAGRFDDAIKTFQKDLQNNKENGWALFGIWQSLSAQKKTMEAAKIQVRFRKAFEKSDIKLTGSVF